MKPQVEIYPNTQALTRAAAERFVRIAETATATQGRFTVALSGGSTPRPLYQLLATDEYLPLVDWSRVSIFWGDERSVPPDSQDSNYHMAREALLDYVPVPISNIYRMRGEVEPVEAAAEYETRLREFFSGRVSGDKPRARFDLVLLGIGDDGHTASLFPHTDALDVEDRWVVANHIPRLDTWRLTLTPPALNDAAHTLFLVAGEAKAPALHQILEGERRPHEYPAQLVQPEDGTLVWLVDRAAASLLPAASGAASDG